MKTMLHVHRKILFSLYLLCQSGMILAQYPNNQDNLIFQVGVGLMLTENYQEAETIFAKLVEMNPDAVAIHNNRGVNLAMQGMSLLKKQEADSLIKYIFPYAVAPDTGKKGNEKKEEERIMLITNAFTMATDQFAHCIRLDTTFAEGYLNLAITQAMLARWLHNDAFLLQSKNNVEIAEKQLSDGSTTKGYCFIVKGIIYDYIGNNKKRGEYFDLAKRQYDVVPDQKLGLLLVRNQRIAMGEPSDFDMPGCEIFDNMENKPETIDGISLAAILNDNSLVPDDVLLDMGEIKLYRKRQNQSTLYIWYENADHYFLFHQTGTGYTGATSKGIRINNNEAYIFEKYGCPLRIQPAFDGKFLYYKRAKLIFHIGNDGTVKSWMVWRAKK